MIKGIIFDLDGVILDSFDALVSSFKEVYHGEGLRVSKKYIHSRIGSGAQNNFRSFFLMNKIPFNDDYIFSLVEKFKKKQQEMIDKIHVFPSFYPLAKQLKDYKMAVATMTNKSVAPFKLKKIKYNFDAVVTFEDVKNPKPFPDIFLAAARKIKIDPLQCVVFEDAIFGVRAAKKAGMKCIGVAAGFYTKKHLLAAGADMAVSSLREREKILKFIGRN